MVKKIFKEPLMAFLLLGAAIFALFQQVSTDYQTDNADIVVSKNQIQSLKLGFNKVWQRSPDANELDKLIKNHIREEVLYREALALGLDKNDSIVRRRLSQKMQFLSEDIADLEKPDDKTLQAYLDDNIDKYMKPSSFSFRQVYFNTGKRGKATQSEAEALLIQLNKGQIDGRDSGDSIMIEYQFDLMRDTEVERLLGAKFIQALDGLPIGSWQGPILSGFGLHLVFIDEFVASEASKLDDVRGEVNRDWMAEKRIETNQAIYDKARQRYSIVVEDFAKSEKAIGQ